MPPADEPLAARARGRTPADPAVRRSWDAVVLGLQFGWLTAADLHRLVPELRAGRDVHIGRISFEQTGGLLRTTVDGGGGSCPPAAMCAELERLLAGPPDPARLVAAPVHWAAAGDPDLPYRARLAGQNLLLRASGGPAGARYTLLVDGVEVAGLPGWPPAWHRPPEPAGPPGPAGATGPAGAAGPGGHTGVAGAARLRVWSERLCRVGPGTPAEILAALGIDGTPRADNWGRHRVEPPPAGVSQIELACTGDRAESLEVTLAGPGLPRTEFDFYFGHGQWLPRVHWDSLHRLAYHVQVAGAPSTCTVFPSFAAEPADGTPAGEVLLRRDRP